MVFKKCRVDENWSEIGKNILPLKTKQEITKAEKSMITGEIKNRIDSIWDTFWVGGITNSITILEQMTYLFFMKMIDDAQRKREANANAFGEVLQNPTFRQGLWHNPETDQDVDYNELRWSVFKHKEPEDMYRTISKDAFVFIKTLNEGKESAYSRFMQNAAFIIKS